MLKRFFMAGLLVWLPILATVVVVRFVIRTLDQITLWLPPAWQPSTWLPYHVPGAAAALVVIAILLTGALVANFLGRRLIQTYEALLQRIPGVRSIYTMVKQSLEVILDQSNQAFSGVVLIEYPKEGVWSLAFLTNDGLQPAEELIQKDLVTVFVPTTPNPTSGFLLLVPRAKTRTMPMSIEQALKYVVSLGTVMHPTASWPPEAIAQAYDHPTRSPQHDAS